MRNGNNSYTIKEHKMKNMFYLKTLLAIVFATGLIFTGCGDLIENEKTIDPRLIGKWEFEKMLMGDGTEYSYPFTIGDVTFSSGGYVFTSDSFTSYMNGHIFFTYPGMYTQNNTFYTQDGHAGYSYTINGNKLTATEANGSGVVANKVDIFSWELQ